MTVAADITITTPTGPSRVCERCKGARFEGMTWPNRGGSTEPAYACRGCGRVYDPQPIDWADVQRDMIAAIDAAYGNTARVFTSGSTYSAYMEEVLTPPKPHRDPHRRENWRAMEKRHAQRHAGKRR